MEECYARFDDCRSYAKIELELNARADAINARADAINARADARRQSLDREIYVRVIKRCQVS